MDFKIGQIVFFKSNGFFSKAIGVSNIIKYGRNDTTHVGIITEIKGREVLIHEALSKGFSASYYPNEFLERGIESGDMHIGEVPVTLTNVLEHANDDLGKPYGFFDIFAILLDLLFGFRITKLTGTKKLICSEAIARILYDASNKHVDFQAEYGKPFDLVDPQNIFLSKQVNILDFN